MSVFAVYSATCLLALGLLAWVAKRGRYAWAGILPIAALTVGVALYWHSAPDSAAQQQKAGKPSQPLTDESAKRVQVVEKALGDPNSELRKLHMVAVATFVSKDDVGQRRIPLPEELERYLPKDWSLEDVEKPAPKVDARELERIHLISLMSFARPADIAKQPDPKGASKHTVTNLKLPSTWRLQSLGLVGLLVHEKPVVYSTSERLRMQNLGKAAKRPTDFLEEAGLEHLRKGDDFYVREREGDLRMLGAIRATEQCLNCHDARRGDLLGAFTYLLTKPVPVRPR